MLNFLFSFILTQSHVIAQDNLNINYFDCDPPPADSAVVFARALVSLDNRWEEKITFSPDGKECFFGRHPNSSADYFKPRVMHSRFKNGKWSKPDTASFAVDKILGYPIISPSGDMVFMEQPINPSPKGVDGRIVFSKKENGRWSEIDSIIPDVASKQGFGQAQITKSKTLYFHDRYDRIAYTSQLKYGHYSKPEPLPYRINPCVEFFASPEDDYIIFNPVNWQNQFHISYKNNDGQWSMPIPLNAYFRKAKITGYGPYVSPDKKYFFFGHDEDIYWVKADFIEVLRKQAFY